MLRSGNERENPAGSGMVSQTAWENGSEEARFCLSGLLMFEGGGGMHQKGLNRA